MLPMVICGLGIVFSIIGMFFVRISDETSSVQKALNLGNWGAIILTVIASYIAIVLILPNGPITLRGITFNKMDVFYAVVVGNVVGAIMSIVTEYFTAMGKAPVLSIVRQSLVEQIPFPKRFGHAEEFASFVCHVFENNMLNGSVLRLDGAVRMGPK